MVERPTSSLSSQALMHLCTRLWKLKFNPTLIPPVVNFRPLVETLQNAIKFIKENVSQASSHIKADCQHQTYFRLSAASPPLQRAVGRSALGLVVLIKLDATLLRFVCVAFFLFRSRLSQSPRLPAALCFIAPQGLLPLTSNNLYVICSAQESTELTASRLASLRYYTQRDQFTLSVRKKRGNEKTLNAAVSSLFHCSLKSFVHMISVLFTDRIPR